MQSPHPQTRARLLACYAEHPSATRGRDHFEDLHCFYDNFTLDIVKIKTSRAWEMLAAKAVWDHPLTKSCTWLQITTLSATLARIVARALHANEELSQASALVLNLGRVPASYEGWRAVSVIMAASDGYDCHAQALRLVEHIEIIHPEYNGLNLTWETKEILTHASKLPNSDPVLGYTPLQPSIEASIALHSQRLALLISALSHTLKIGLLTPEKLRAIPTWQSCENHITSQYKMLEERRRQPMTISYLRDMLILDLIKTSRVHIEAEDPASPDAVRQSEKKYISHSPPIVEDLQALEDIFNTLLNHDPRRLTERRYRIARIRSLLTLLQSNITLLGHHAYHQLRKDPPQKVVCDYLCFLGDEDIQKMAHELLLENDTLPTIQPTLRLE